MHHDFDTIVVGAGPTGLALSLLLARRGHRVALMDRWAQPYPQPRAIGMNHEALRVLHQAGGDERMEQVMEHTEEHAEAQLVAVDGEVLVRMPNRAIAESGWPEMQGFNQPDVEAYLEELTNESPALKVMRNVLVTGLDRSAEGVTVQYRTADGKGLAREGSPLRSVTGKFVVGCDGANSFIAAQTQLQRTHLDFGSEWLITDIRPRTPGKWTLSPFLAVVLDPTRPTTCAHAGPGRRRFEFMLMPGERREDMLTAEAAWAQLAKWKVTPENAELVRHVVYRFRGNYLENWREGRVLIAGDAAHLMPPFLAQGFNSCVRDAANLSMHLDLVLRGLAPLNQLDRYTEERLPHVRSMVEISVFLAHQIGVVDPEAARERNEGLRAMRDSGERIGAPAMTLESGMLARNDTLAGTLSHQGRVEHAGRVGNFDDICCNGCFTLIGVDADPAKHLGPQARDIWQRLAGQQFHVGEGSPWRDVDGTYACWLRDQGVSVVLVRPDYYCFGSSSKASDADRLVLELGASLGLVAEPALAPAAAESRAPVTADALASS